MTPLLLALIAGIIGIIPIFFSKNKSNILFSSILLLASYTLFGWWAFYSLLPSLAYPMFGWVSSLIIIWLCVSTIISIFGIDDTDINWSWVLPVVSILILIFVGFSGCNTFRNKEYSKLIGNLENKNQTHWSQDIQPLDPNHIRLVSPELALTNARLSLSQDGATFGSQFELAENYITLQKIKNDYFYLIPLDYASYSVWTNAKCVPGYVKVSATNPFATSELITDKKIIYTPNAYFSENLERKLWYKYYNKVLMDYSFEEDDNGNVYWVVSVCEPTISYWGLVVEGVVLVNTETGEDKYISNNILLKDSTYKWIDRVYPKELIEEYISYWGTLKGGWWNKVWSNINLLQPETPTLNYSADGNCVFVTPITSTNNKDQSMTGLIYTDARSGKSTYYTVSKGSTEESIIEVVNNAVAFMKWHASEQIVYENIYGKMSAIVPILSENGKNYMGIAIVETENKRVARGATPNEALIEYRKIIAEIGGQITTVSNKDIKLISGKILRIGWDMSGTGKQYYLYIDSKPNYSFIVTSSVQSELALSKEGDSVRISYIESNENPITSMSFKNINLNFKYSSNQNYIDSSMNKNNSINTDKKDIKDFKEDIKKMNDEDLKKLLDKTK